MKPLGVLVVEDDAVVGRDLRETVEEMGHRVFAVVASGDDAIRALREHEVDLVLLDVRISGSDDGIDLANRVAREWGLPVVYLTALTDDETLERARASRPFSYLVKPVDPRELRTAIEVAVARHAVEARLRKRKRWLGAVVDSVTDALVAVDLRGRVTLFNPSAEALTGFDRDDAVGRPVDRILTFRDGATGEPLSDPLLRTLDEDRSRPLAHGTLLARRDGTWIPVSGGAAPVRGSGADLLGCVLTARDARARSTDRSHPGGVAERYRTAFDANPLPVHVSGLEGGRILDVNPSFEDVFGHARADAVGRTEEELDLWSRPEERRELREALGDEDAVAGFRARLRTASGSIRDVDLSARRVEVEGVPSLLVVTRDVTERVAFEEEMERRALYDTLTGLPNRTLLRDRLGHALDRARRDDDAGAAVLFIDLDRFKEVNDTLGHAAGDEVLRHAARRIRDCFREEDTVARIGGDEFAAILEDAHHADAAVVAARRVLGALEPPFPVHGSSVRIGASVGIALPPDPTVEVDELLRFGDAAMYRAKREGGGAYRVFEPDVDSTAVGLHRTKRRLREGLERREFVLRYQPIVELETGRVRGAEALVRWRCPERGVLRPDEFLPLVEESGLASRLGRRLLRSALGALSASGRSSPSGGVPFLTMNLTPAHFRDPDVADELEEVLGSVDGVDRTRLVLEVSEGVALQAPNTVRRIRALGVRVALDDVGTGHVSLATRRDVTVDALKLDRSFVGGLGRNHADAVILRTMLAYGEGMGHWVVAEGIETPRQAQRLREMGCVLGQGYHFHEPVTADAFAALLG